MTTTAHESGRRFRISLALPASSAARFVSIATSLWLVLFWGYGFLRYRAFFTAQLDFGDMLQAVWNTAHGRFLESTTLAGENVSRLGIHVDPLLAALAPLWWVWSSPVLLVTVLAIGLASGVVPVFLLARKHVGTERAARDLALVYLLCPMTQWNAVWDFHAVSLAIPLVLWAIWFLDEDRLLPFAACGLLAAASKEEIPLAVGCRGIWYAFNHGRRAVGATIFVVGAAITLVDFLVIVPHFWAAGASPFAKTFANIGGAPSGILHTAAADPTRILGALFTMQNLGYVVLLSMLFAGMFFRAPLIALGAVPDLAINMLSTSDNQHSLQFQYAAGLTPFLIAATIFGVARVHTRIPLAPLIVLAFALFASVVFGPLRFSVPVVQAALPHNAERQADSRAIATIPSGEAVSASNRLAGHLAARRWIYVFPYVGKARWVIVDLNDPTYKPHALLTRGVRRVRRLPGWHVVFSQHNVLVLHRT